MRLRVLESAAAVAKAAADALAAAAAGRPDLLLALPTGRTPLPFYDELARRHSERTLDLTAARAFNLDELMLPAGDERSFRCFMERHAWGRTGLASARCHLPDVAASDPEAECERYEQAIRQAGGLDLAILGLGADGHVAYNMPGPPTRATHVVRLPDGLAAALGLPPSAWPLRAITMGLATIHAARSILIMATGEHKAAAVRALQQGKDVSEWPCAYLTDHPNLDLILDRPAAASLS